VRREEEEVRREEEEVRREDEEVKREEREWRGYKDACSLSVHPLTALSWSGSSLTVCRKHAVALSALLNKLGVGRVSVSVQETCRGTLCPVEQGIHLALQCAEQAIY